MDDADIKRAATIYAINMKHKIKVMPTNIVSSLIKRMLRKRLRKKIALTFVWSTREQRDEIYNAVYQSPLSEWGFMVKLIYRRDPMEYKVPDELIEWVRGSR